MEIKYEAVFGDQSLFDGMMSDCDFASEAYGYKFAKGVLYYCEKNNEKAGWWPSCKSHLTFKPSAMRRIIKTPVWTVADQKAGKLPDVGCECVYLRNGLIGEIVSIDDSDADDVELCLRFKDKSLLVCKIDQIKPIETPEEKAARLRMEWCNEAGLVCSLGMTTLTRIYDALLSGELTAPTKGE